ncbi:UNVERIFIED_CONTAM: hypothetical protein RF648_20345, partial [Kocuria sp. CPCC 205274]
EIPMSFTELQVKSAFSSAAQLNGFISMLVTSVENSLTVKIDAFIMRGINNMIGETLVSELATGAAGSKVVDYTKSGVRAVNLLKLYNDTNPTTKVSVASAMTNRDFVRFATYQIGIVADRMTKISKLFNIGGKERFTAPDMRRAVLLSDFSKSVDTLSAALLENPDRIALPAHDVVPYWQGSGKDYALSSTGIIDVKTASGETVKLPAKGVGTGKKNAAIIGVL